MWLRVYTTLVEKTSECGRFGAPFYLSADVQSCDDGIAFEGPYGSTNGSTNGSANGSTNGSTNGNANCCPNGCAYCGQSGISNLLFEGTDGWLCPSCEALTKQPISDLVAQ